jgi:hypothetical protein
MLDTSVPAASQEATSLSSPGSVMKTVCLGLDWFDDDNPCPYKDSVNRMSDGSKVTDDITDDSETAPRLEPDHLRSTAGGVVE